MNRIAFIDLGSNSVRYVVMEIARDLSYKLIYQQKEAIRLSEGLFPENKLTEPAIQRALQALRAFARMGEIFAVECTTAVATAAVRQASNGEEFITRVAEETGFQIQCISGVEEARLGYIGVANTTALSDFLLFDLGGASTEVTLVRNRMIVHSYSFPIGALTLKERFQQGKEMNNEEYHAMAAYLIAILSEQKWLKHCKLPVVGIGGTVRNIGKMDQRQRQYPIQKLHNYEVSLDAFAHLQKEVRSKTLSQRKKIPGLSTDRADIIIPGMAIVQALLEYTKGTQLVVSGNGLREGLFYDFYGKNYRLGNPIVQNSLRHSTENYFLNLAFEDGEQIRQVAHLADMLFTQLAPLHQLDVRMRELLYVGSLLHDAGKVVNYYSHPKHSTYMILNGPIYGLTHHEQAMAAFIGGFAHGVDIKMPRMFVSAQLLNEEDWKIIRKTSILLALAAALENVDQHVCYTEVTIKEKEVHIHIVQKEAPEDTLMNPLLPKLLKQFKKDYGRTLRLTYATRS